MKLTVFQGDITCLNVDAVVNAANRRMLGGGGVDGAIHNAAGRRLRAACERFPEISKDVRVEFGQAQITPGFDMPAKAVIHTVGPVYAHKTARSSHRALTSHPDPANVLASCYRESLKVAVKYRHRTVAFSAISCGVYGYPPEDAALIAVGVASEQDWDVDEVVFVAFEDEVKDALEKAIATPPDTTGPWLDIMRNRAAIDPDRQAAPAPVAAAPAPAATAPAATPTAAATAPAADLQPAAPATATSTPTLMATPGQDIDDIMAMLGD
jgi:O-acetyl-ADP-ribose deacetylase (regulator of RNase III)